MRIRKHGNPEIIKREAQKLREKKLKKTCCCWEGNSVSCVTCGCALELTIADPVSRYGGGGGHYLACPECGNSIHVHCKQNKCCQN